MRRPAVHRHGVRRGPHPARPAAGRAAARRRHGRSTSPRGVLAALEYSHRGRHRPPRHQAGQRHADAERRRQGHGLRHRPGDGRRVRDDDPDRRPSSARPSTCRRSRRAARPSTPAATSTPRAACSTSCSPGGRRSSATPRSPSPTSTSVRSRSRRACTTRRCRKRWTGSCCTPWPRTGRRGTRRRTTSARTSRPPWPAGRCPPSPPGRVRRPARRRRSSWGQRGAAPVPSSRRSASPTPAGVRRRPRWEASVAGCCRAPRSTTMPATASAGTTAARTGSVAAAGPTRCSHSPCSSWPARRLRDLEGQRERQRRQACGRALGPEPAVSARH